MRGHDDVRLFNNPYYSNPIKVRSLYAFELDEIEAIALAECSESTAKFILKYKLMSDKTEEEEIDYDKLDINEVKKYFDMIDYYIAFYACRDYQDKRLKKYLI